MTATPIRFTSPAARLLTAYRTPGRPVLVRVLLWGSALLASVAVGLTLPGGVAGILIGCVVSGALLGVVTDLVK